MVAAPLHAATVKAARGVMAVAAGQHAKDAVTGPHAAANAVRKVATRQSALKPPSLRNLQMSRHSPANRAGRRKPGNVAASVIVAPAVTIVIGRSVTTIARNATIDLSASYER